MNRCIMIKYASSIKRLPLPEGVTDEMIEIKLKQQFNQVCVDMASQPEPQDAYILYDNVVYRFCKSSKQAKKITGKDAKEVKRALKVWQQNQQ